MQTRHIVPVVRAEYIPASFKQPLFVKVNIVFDEETGAPLFSAEALVSPVSVERKNFSESVVDTVSTVFKRYLTLRNGQRAGVLAPNLQDEYKILDAIFEYHDWRS